VNFKTNSTHLSCLLLIRLLFRTYGSKNKRLGYKISSQCNWFRSKCDAVLIIGGISFEVYDCGRRFVEINDATVMFLLENRKSRMYCNEGSQTYH
jgi:hypothetical protein